MPDGAGDARGRRPAPRRPLRREMRARREGLLPERYPVTGRAGLQGEDLLLLVDEAAAGHHARRQQPWLVAIVDDDPEVHSATVYALTGVEILGRTLSFVHAYSAAEAERVLRSHPETAVVMLDVVMDTEDAGLRLVRLIREGLAMDEVRIILRTGQPGYAPELEVIRDYDINDYRTKSELTRTRLLTSLTAALRSFEQIRTIAAGRRGLEKIVQSAAPLLQAQALEQFAEGVLVQIAALVGVPPEGIVCAQRGSPLEAEDAQGLYVVGAVGRLAGAVTQRLEDLGDARIAGAIYTAMGERRHLFGADHTVLYINGSGREAAVFLDTSRPLHPTDRQLLEVFSSNIAASYSNLQMFRDLQYVAYFDPLTRLPNRRRFVQMLGDARGAGAGAGRSVALLDIEQFSDINDFLGDETGDSLIQAVAARLSGALPRSRVARAGGDSFGVIGPDEEVRPERIAAVFRDPFLVRGYELPVTVSAGFTAVDPAVDSGDELARRASIALDRAKHGSGPSFTVFTGAMRIELAERVDLLRRLRAAVRTQALELHYQPQVALDDGQVTGLEALLRWRDEDGHQVPPSLFVPLAEHSGLIVEIGDWVAAEAARQVREWEQSGLSGLRVGVNVSMPQFRRPDFVAEMARNLARHGADPRRFELEITENMIMGDLKATLKCLRQLQEAGYQLAIDDFGTGYSSLSYLQQLPVHRMKIDRSFVHDIGGRERRGEKIARMIVALGQTLGLDTVAEGIETEEQMQVVREWGCREAQGFLVARPMPAAEAARWVRARAELA